MNREKRSSWGPSLDHRRRSRFPLQRVIGICFRHPRILSTLAAVLDHIGLDFLAMLGSMLLRISRIHYRNLPESRGEEN